MKTFADFGIEVTAASGETYTTCPQCSRERRKKRAKCLGVNVTEGVWVCHHCGWAGTLKDGAQRHEPHWQKPPRRPDPRPLTALPPKVVDWFANRGISEKTLAANPVGYGSAYMPQTEDHENCVIFEYTRDREVINRKYRDGKKNFRMEAGCERILFGLDTMATTTIICEGEIDALTLRSLGFAAVSVPDGAPTPDAKNYAAKFTFLDEPKLEEVSEWIIAVDSDEPGQRLEDELARRLGREKCKRVIWPKGMKDANEVLVQAGADVLADCISRAEPYPIDGVFSVLDISTRIDRLYENGWERGVSTGWPAVDNHYTVRPGELTVITGIPNSGKSNWVDALTVNLARQHGWSIGVFSPENQPIEDHAARLMEMWAEEPFHDGPNARMSREVLDSGKAWLNDHFRWILPDDDTDWTVEVVLDAAKALVKRHGIRGLVIDPWNELEQFRGDMTETEYVSHALKRCRQFARRMGVHVWMVAHPAKLYKDKDGVYPVPSLYEISGSAHWRNKADNGISIWRDFANSMAPVEVHVQKIRFRQIGSIGMAQLRYRKMTDRYFDAGAA